MGFDFASAKRKARRVVHDTLGVSAFYQDTTMSVAEAITARWHNKVVRQGDLESAGYAEVIDGIDRIVLVPEDTPCVEFRQGGTITFEDDGRVFRLVNLEPDDGPLRQIWHVVQE